MRDASSIFPFIIFINYGLFAIFNAIPIDFKIYVVNRVTIKHKLTRKRPAGSVTRNHPLAGF